MNNHFCGNPGTSKLGGRYRGSGPASYGYGLRYPMNRNIVSAGLINNGVSSGLNNGFGKDHSGVPPSNIPTNIGNLYFTHGHPMVGPMFRGIADTYSRNSIPLHNEYSSVLNTDFNTTYVTDDENSGNPDTAGPMSSDFSGMLRHHELRHSFEELNAKVHGSFSMSGDDTADLINRCLTKTQETGYNKDDISQIEAYHLLMKRGKFSLNDICCAMPINEPKQKNAEQQTESVQQRNVSQQTYTNCCNDENNIVIDELQNQFDSKKKKNVWDYKSLDNDNRQAAVESMRLPTGKIDLKGVAGLSDVKIDIRETFLLPLTHPHLFDFFQGSVKRCCRCLLYGPPGTGKTLLAQAIASELGASLYYVSCAGILSCYIGESEKNVKELFEHALEQEAPSIIFFDEIDSVCRKRTEGESEHSRRLKTELLKYFENPAMEESRVYVLSATNCPWDLDPAFLRRFQRHIYIPLPDREARKQIISQQLGHLRVLLSESDWDQIMFQTEGFSGSDLMNFVSIAMAQPNREILRATHWRCLDGDHVIPCDPNEPNSFNASLDDVPPEKVMARNVALEDFLSAARETPRTVTEEHILQFENFKRHFSR